MSLIDEYKKLQNKSFDQISKMGLQKNGFVNDFDTPIWFDKFGVPSIKCIPQIEIFDKDENLETKKPQDNKGKIEEKGKIHNIPIIKMAIDDDSEVRNPITIKNVIEAYIFFGIPKEHFKGLKEIVISNEIPKDKWAFGTYNIKKKENKYIDNRITLWAQKVKIMNGEIRYEIYPSNIPGPLFLKSERFFYEILGDTIIHELGHHYDLWINKSPMGGNGWVIRAENIAEKYTRSFTAIKRRSEDFLSIMTKYGESDNKDLMKKLEVKNNKKKLNDISLDNSKN
jgi:hypothetical protein